MLQKIFLLELTFSIVVKKTISHIEILGLDSNSQFLTPIFCQCGSWEAAVIIQVIGFLPPTGDLMVFCLSFGPASAFAGVNQQMEFTVFLLVSNKYSRKKEKENSYFAQQLRFLQGRAAHIGLPGSVPESTSDSASCCCPLREAAAGEQVLGSLPSMWETLAFGFFQSRCCGSLSSALCRSKISVSLCLSNKMSIIFLF